jgi:adenylyl cyclase-associated protein
VEWVQSFYGIFKSLLEYTKQYFANGVTWNPAGKPADEAAKSMGANKSAGAPKTANTSPPVPPPTGGLPPPPPPPPGPPPVLDIKEETSGKTDSPGGLGAVFSELNRGDAVTKGLRKVDKSEMTHKNPSLRASSTVGDSSARGKSPAPGKKPKPESMRVKKPPRKELDGNKWTIVSGLRPWL